MKLSLLCKCMGAECPYELLDIDISSVTSNSKKVKEGSLFVCLQGLHTDGHRYMAEALRNGAAALIAERNEYLLDRVIISKNCRQALSLALNALCGFPAQKMKFVGITGTNGKTSVSALLRHILNSVGKRCALLGTVGAFAPNGEKLTMGTEAYANMTTPDPEELYPLLARLYDMGSEFVIMEASSHSLFLDKLYPIDFDVGIFTNLTQDHLDFHGGMEEYFRAKEKLFKQSKLAIINIDDSYGKRLCTGDLCPKISCTLEKGGDFRADDVELLGAFGVRYRMHTPYGELCAKIKTPGGFSVMNSMQAAACALELGVQKEQAARALESFSGVDGRLERVEICEKAGFSVFIDYAHTPDALSKVLKTLKKAQKDGERLILLFGCGGDRDRGKRPKMGKIATENADIVIITSDNPREEDREKIIDDIVSGVEGKNNYIVIPSRRDAIRFAVNTARRGDIALFAGKGHEKYEIIGKEKFFFDESELAKAYINERFKEEVQ